MAPRILSLLSLLACLAATALSSMACAQADPIWPARPVFSEGQRARFDSLARHATASLAGLPVSERPGAARNLAGDFISLGRCDLAEPLIRDNAVPASALPLTIYPVAGLSDHACPDRLISLVAVASREPGPTGIDAWNLYLAGAMWRRIGERRKSDDAIAEAEQYYDRQEAADPIAPWTCHGGNCLSPRWGARLAALALYRGSQLHRAELRWLASLALSQWYARDARHPAPRVGQRLFEELLREAVNAGDQPLAMVLAEPTPDGAPAAFAGEQMRQLLDRGRIAEALELWPTAGPAFRAPISPGLLRANLALFHRWRDSFRQRWSDSGELHSLLAQAWMERGDREHAREALTSAHAAEAATGGLNWGGQHRGRLRAVESMLDGDGDPVARLAGQDFPGSPLHPSRDYAFAELATLLVATNRPDEARRALAEINDARFRRHLLVELPCRAAAGGEAAALAAIRLVGRLRPLDRSRDEETSFSDASYQAFQCLIRGHRSEAAIAYALAVENPDTRLTLLTEMPVGDGLADDAAVRRRLAMLALALVEARHLWGDTRIAGMAADFERVGDFAQADRILARARGTATRLEVFDRLLRRYGADHF
jgi:hypothetical protein